MNMNTNRKKWHAGLILLLTFFCAIALTAQTAGPNLPNSGTTLGAGNPWNNPGNITAADGTSATVSVSSSGSSRYLYASGFDFNIPAGATITGVQARIHRRGSSTSSPVRDRDVYLTTTGAPMGNDLASGTGWPTSLTSQIYGGMGNMWGTTLTAAQVNAAGFGLLLSVESSSIFSRTASVDYIELTVYFAADPTISSVSTWSVCAGSASPITIYGTNFINVSNVYIGAQPVTFSTISSSQLLIWPPTISVSGPIRIYTLSGDVMSATNFTVHPLPVVGALTGPSQVCVGSSITLSSTTSGGVWTSLSPAASVVNGVVTGIATGSAVIRYTYTNPSTGCSNYVTRTITVVNTPTVITSHPVSQVKCAGDTAAFSVSATGSGLTYQWYRGGSPLSNGGTISGATSQTLTITNAGISDVFADYYCLVTGACGQLSSDPAGLTITEPVVVTGEPASVAICSTQPASFSVIHSGIATSYQWYKDGVALSDNANISGSATATLQLASASASDASSNYYCVISGESPCGSVTSQSVALTVLEIPVIVSQPTANQTVCAGDPLGISIFATGGNLTYQWYRGATMLTDTAMMFGTNTDTLYFNSVAPGDAASDYHVVVSNSCSAVTSDMAAVVVNAKPVIPNQSATICSGDAFSVVPVDGVPDAGVIVPAGTTYSWDAPVVTGGITGGSAESGQSMISQALINPTASVQTATYTVTPVSGTSGNCVGDPFTVTVTIEPTPFVNNIAVATCSGAPLVITPSNGGGNIVPAGTTYSWTAPVVTGGLTGGSAGADQADINQTLVNPTNTTQTATYIVTATSGTCTGTTFTVAVTVYPKPTVAATPLTQTICSGSAITSISMTNPNNVGGSVSYLWTRDNVSTVTGLAASGTGPISGTLNNTSAGSATVNFTITALTGDGCESDPIVVSVTVETVPLAIATPSSQTVCSGLPITPVALSTSNAVPGVTYSWTRDNTGNLTGIATSGSGDVSGTLINMTNVAQTTTFTVTADNNGCTYDRTFTITVNPQPTISVSPATQTVCGGVSIANIVALNPNNLGSVSFSWTRDNTANVTGMPASGSGSLLSGSLQNMTSTDQTVVFTFVASAAGCASVAATATVVVRATPLATATPSSQSICNNTASTAIVLADSRNVPGTIFTWVRNNTTNITGLPSSGSGASIGGTLTNATATTQTTTFTITATAPNGCTSITTAAITIYPDLTAPTISGTQTVCAGSTPTPLAVSVLPNGGTSIYGYQWQSGTSSTGPWTNIPGATNITYQPPQTSASTPTTYYQLVATSCGTLVSNVVTVSVANNLNFTFSTSAGATTLCSGAAFNPTITSGQFLPDSVIRYSWSGNVNYITPVTGGPILGSVTYWPFPWLPLFAVSSATLPLSVVNNTNADVTTTLSITPTIYNAATNAIICSLSPQTVTVTIRPRPQATVIAPAVGTSICSNSNPGITIDGNLNTVMSYSITRSANANVTSSVTFPISSGNVAAGGTYTIPDTLTNLSASVQTITYTITPSSAAGCTGTPITYSISVLPSLLPGTLSASQTICNGGDPAVITQVTPATGGGTLSYQWFSGSSASGPWTAIGGATGLTYDPPAAPVGDVWYIRQVTATVNGVTCSVQNSAPVRVSVNVASPGTVNGNQTICSGSTPTALASTAPGTGPAGSIISYQWQSNTIGCGGSWTNIPGATGATYTPGALSVTTYFRRVTTSTLNGVPCTAESACITVTINQVTAGTVGNDQAICGSNPAAFVVITPATASGTLSYQWQSSTASCSGPWTNIAGPAGTGATYDPPAGVTVNTYYRRIVTSVLNGVTCTATSNCITVLATTVTAGSISGNRTVCMGGDPAAFIEMAPATGTNLSYQWQISSNGAAGPWSDIAGATGQTYDHPGPITSTAYFKRVVTSTNGSLTCSAETPMLTVFVNSISAPVVTGDQNICAGAPSALSVSTVATASGVLTYQWQSSAVGCSGPWSNIGGATSPTYTPTVMSGTMYYQLVATSTLNGVSCTAVSNCVVVSNYSKMWTGAISADWNNAGNWSPAGVPTAAHCVVIPNVTTDPIISGASFVAHAYSLTVLSGGRLDVTSGNTIHVENVVQVHTGGNMFLQNTAALVQTDDVANTGNIVVQRITQPMHRFDFTYWGSPLVTGAFTLGNLSPNTLPDKYYSWTPTISGGAGNWAQESAATQMISGKGYIVRAPQHFSTNPTITQPYTATFVGVPSNGHVAVPIQIGSLGAGVSTDKLNLISNPYPSAVDADAFLSDPINAGLIDGTIYFWTHHAPPSAAFPSPFYGSFILNYSPNGYASYNLLGGTNTVPSGYGGPAPDGSIASAQGFFVKGLAAGSASFENNMRMTGNNATFFRMQSGEKHRIWLNLANEQGAFSQALVGYAHGATDGEDRGFDGGAMSAGSVSLYSMIDTQKFGIQGLSLPFEVDDLIPLGMSSATAGTYHIAIDKLDGIFTGQMVYLEDKLLNIIHDLKQSPYTFATAAGTFDQRFVLRFTDGSTLSQDEHDASRIIAFVSDSKFYLQTAESIDHVTIVDIAGKKILTHSKLEPGVFSMPFEYAEGIYVVRIETASGKVISVKLHH